MNRPSIGELFDLTGRVVLLTGGGGHLGGAMAWALAEAGASVVLTSRDRARAQAAAGELPVLKTARHAGIAMDQADAGSLERGFADAVAVHGRLDGLINNAHDPVGHDWRDVTADQFDRTLRNVTSYFLLARHLREHAVSRGAPASIILIGSMYGLVGSYPDAYEGICNASPVSYHAAKGGIVQMSRHLAVYWARDRVRVNCLSPGPFPREQVDPRLIERLIEKSPMRRVGQPSELKGAVVFLASDASSYVTGHNLVVDGGWTAW
jgi:NAD(P)-dependent dehydrogenase (short-subunit alcohol dehydrogenase family)